MFLLIAFMLNTLHADQVPCAKFMPCGAWEGKALNLEDGNPSEPWIERLEVHAVDDHTYRLTEVMWERPDKDEEMYSLQLILKFTDDGRYTVAAKDGGLFASGVCANNVCTFDFTPWAWKSEDGKQSGVTGNVNVLRFTDDHVERTMLATSLPGKHMVQKSVMRLER